MRGSFAGCEQMRSNYGAVTGWADCSRWGCFWAVLEIDNVPQARPSRIRRCAWTIKREHLSPIAFLNLTNFA
jgi:hypothetical protein